MQIIHALAGIQTGYSWLTICLTGLLAIGAWSVVHRGKCELRTFGKDDTLPLRGLLALLVVIGHLDNHTGHFFQCLSYIHWSTPAVGVFFFLSGYGVCKSYEGAVRSGRDSGYAGRFLLKALIRLLPLLLSTWIILLAYQWMVGGFRAELIFHKVYSGEFVQTPGSWYVYALLIFYLGFCLAMRFESLCFRMLVLLAVVTGYYMITRYSLSLGRNWWQTAYAFPVGYLFSAQEGRIRDFVARHPIAGYSFAIVLFLGAFGLYRLNGIPLIGKAREPFFAILGVPVVLWFYSGGALRRFGPLRMLGVCSYEIYLVHCLFLREFQAFGLSPYAYVALVLGVTALLVPLLYRFDSLVIGLLSRK